MQNIAAVILAGGGSSRLGRPKQFLKFRGKTLLRRIVDAAIEAGCSPVVVVTGSETGRISDELKGSRAEMAENEDWGSGIGTSIRIGVQHLGNEVDAAVMLVCDQPLVDALVIRQLMDLRKQTGKAIVASSYGDTLGVPALFDRSCFTELLALEGDVGAKKVILSDFARVEELLFPGGKVDIDSAADCEQLRGNGLESI